MVAELGLENAVNISKAYFIHLGIDKIVVDRVLDSDLFDGGFVQILTDTGVPNSNKKNKGAHTSHIAITGMSRSLFYPLELIKNTTKSSNDSKVELKIVICNLEHLKSVQTVERGNITMPAYTGTKEVIFQKSSTVKKISCRKTGGNQVQLSKVKSDGGYFIKLRQSVLVGDALIFLKYKDQEELLVLGIPNFNLNIQDLNEKEIQSLHKKMNSNLRPVTAKTIGSYRLNEDRERTDTSNMDINNSIDIRLERSMRHHKMVEVLGEILEKAGFLLHEGKVDCLAYKENVDILMFEAKTLNGQVSDEMNQVRAALGQLLYYEVFDTGQYNRQSKIRIAFFESEISQEHIAFLKGNNCYVIWLNGRRIITGEKESLELMKNLHIIT